jgi:hypothetical protein
LLQGAPETQGAVANSQSPTDVQTPFHRSESSTGI